MNVTNLFPETFTRAPRNGHVPQSGNTVTHASIHSPEIVGRVDHGFPDRSSKLPSAEWWRKVQVLLKWWYRMMNGPNLAGTKFNNTPNDLHQDLVFEIVSIHDGGKRIRLKAINETWDARDSVLGVEILENPFWIQGDDNGPPRYFFRGIRGSLQLFDDVTFHPNSVLFYKARPAIIDIADKDGNQNWGAYQPGDDFSIIVDQDCTHARTKRDPDGDAPNHLTVRLHLISPSPMKEIDDFVPFKGRYTEKIVMLDDLVGGKFVLNHPIAIPSLPMQEGFVKNVSVIVLNQVDGVLTEFDVTQNLVNNGDIKIEHGEIDGEYITTFTLSDYIGGSVIGFKLAYFAPDEKGQTVCQFKCKHSMKDNNGRAYCRLAYESIIDFQNNTSIPNPPSGLEKFRDNCYQYNSCNRFQPSEPFGYETHMPDLLPQIFVEHGVTLNQQNLGGTPIFYLQRQGVTESFASIGAARLDREIELGVERKTLLQTSRCGYVKNDADKTFVQGIYMPWDTPAVGINRANTNVELSLLEKRGVTHGLKDGLGRPYDDDTDSDPIQPLRTRPWINVRKAESNRVYGRNIRFHSNVVAYADVHPDVTLDSGNVKANGFYFVHSSLNPNAYHVEEWVSNTIQSVYVGWDKNPLSVFENENIVIGTIASANKSNTIVEIEITNPWREVITIDTSQTPVLYGSGQIKTGGQFVRPAMEYEFVNDDGNGDGQNPLRGCITGDIVTIEHESLRIGPSNYEGFTVDRAQAMVGSTEPYGWNGNVNATATVTLILPENHDAWGRKRDKIFIYDPDNKINTSLIVGSVIKAHQAGIFSGHAPLNVIVNGVKQSPPQIISRKDGVVKIPRSSLNLNGNNKVKLEGHVFDRRRHLHLKDVHLIRNIFGAMDTFRVPADMGGFQGLSGSLFHEENLCKEEYGIFKPTDNPPGSVWVPEKIQSDAYLSQWTTNASIIMGHGDLHVFDNRVSWTNMQAPVIPFSSTLLGSIPDGVTFSNVSLKVKLQNVTFRETINQYPKGTYSSTKTVNNLYGAGSVSCVIFAQRGNDPPQPIMAGPSISVVQDQWQLLPITNFFNSYMTSWRRSEYHNFFAVVFPPSYNDKPIQRKIYQSYAPISINCSTAENNDEGGTSEPNQFYLANRAYTIKSYLLEYESVGVDGFIFTIGSFPSAISGYPISSMRVIHGPNMRRTWPWTTA